jgi:DnaJ-class molecular chaperone
MEDWMIRKRDPETFCAYCNGSGEGMHDGTRCTACGGHGTGPAEDDYDFEPDLEREIEREEYWEER